jgi:hypothetical protein
VRKILERKDVRTVTGKGSGVLYPPPPVEREKMTERKEGGFAIIQTCVICGRDGCYGSTNFQI